MLDITQKLARRAAGFPDQNGADAILDREAVEEIERLRRLLMRARPHIEELAAFSAATARHRDLSEAINTALGAVPNGEQ